MSVTGSSIILMPPGVAMGTSGSYYMISVSDSPVSSKGSGPCLQIWEFDTANGKQLVIEFGLNADGNTAALSMQNTALAQNIIGFQINLTDGGVIDNNYSQSGAGTYTMFTFAMCQGTRTREVAGDILIASLTGTNPTVKFQVVYTDPNGNSRSAILRIITELGTVVDTITSAGYYSLIPYFCRTKNLTSLTLNLILGGTNPAIGVSGTNNSLRHFFSRIPMS